MILEFPNYLDSEITKEIRDAVKPFIPCKKETAFNRDGNTVQIRNIPELKNLNDKIHQFFSKVQKEVIQCRYKPQFASAYLGYEYHLYNANDVCRYHTDGEVIFNDENQAFLRYASVIFHLNTVHEGGELVFPDQNIKIKTEEGKLVVFPPYGMFGHYTTPSNEAREVLVSWFVYKGIHVVKTNP